MSTYSNHPGDNKEPGMLKQIKEAIFWINASLIFLSGFVVAAVLTFPAMVGPMRGEDQDTLHSFPNVFGSDLFWAFGNVALLPLALAYCLNKRVKSWGNPIICLLLVALSMASTLMAARISLKAYLLLIGHT